MSIEINDSSKTHKYKIKNHKKATSSNIEIDRIKNKVNANKNKQINVQSNLNILIPTNKFSKQNLKSLNRSERSLKVKNQIVDKKGKEKEKEKENENEKEKKEKPDYHKIKDLNQKNNNLRNSNENINLKNKKKSNFNLKKNPNENEILKLVTFANKIFEDEEHFQKDFFMKREKYIHSRPNTKRSMHQQKRNINNEKIFKISKELLPESGNKNIHLRRRLSSSTKLRFSNDFIKSKKSNIINLLKLKHNMPKENEDDTKNLFDTQENNNKIKNYKFNNNDVNSKPLNNQNLLIRSKTIKHSKSKDYSSHKKIKDVKEEETIKKSINKNNLIKVSTQKSNNTKSNNNKTQNQDLESIKKESRKKFKKYRNNYYCFLCCLNSKKEDSDNDE